MVEKDKKDKVTYVDFKSTPPRNERKETVHNPLHTNPLVDKLFRLVHTKLSKGKEDYRSYTEFKPDDL